MNPSQPETPVAKMTCPKCGGPVYIARQPNTWRCFMCDILFTPKVPSAEAPVAGVEQHCRCAECGAEWVGPVGQQDGLTRCNCGSTAIEETPVREPENANAILIESEPAERSLDEKIHPEYWRGREHQLTEDENAIAAQREVIATLTSRVAELEKERDDALSFLEREWPDLAKLRAKLQSVKKSLAEETEKADEWYAKYIELSHKFKP